MRNLLIIFVFAIAIVFLFRDGGDESTNGGPQEIAENASLRGAETFTWNGDQPISFAPPPIGWEASRYQQGGLSGVDYVKRGSVGERISIAEYYKVGRRDGCSMIREVLDGLDTLSTSELKRKLRSAVYGPERAINAREKRILTSLRQYTHSALGEIDDGHFNEARRQLDQALRIRGQNRFKLNDFIDEVMFDLKPGGDVVRVDIGQPQARWIGDEQAQTVDYEIDVNRQFVGAAAEMTTFAGREAYVMSNNRLFVLNFQGLRENLALFDRVVDSITFPKGLCSL
jgi:hypothetical protein